MTFYFLLILKKIQYIVKIYSNAIRILKKVWPQLFFSSYFIGCLHVAKVKVTGDNSYRI